MERHQALAGQPERGHPGGLEVAVELLQPDLVFSAVKIRAVEVVHGVLLPASMSRSAFLSSLPILVTGNSATISSPFRPLELRYPGGRHAIPDRAQRYVPAGLRDDEDADPLAEFGVGRGDGGDLGD